VAESLKAQAGRLGALTIHAQGKTNTTPAKEAFLSRFEREVDPLGQLDPADRARRAAFARKAYFGRLAMRSAAVRRRNNEGRAPRQSATLPNADAGGGRRGQG
jgi:hypothetical protein